MLEIMPTPSRIVNDYKQPQKLSGKRISGRVKAENREQERTLMSYPSDLTAAHWEQSDTIFSPATAAAVATSIQQPKPKSLQKMKDESCLAVQKTQAQEVAVKPVKERAHKQRQSDIQAVAQPSFPLYGIPE